MNDSVEQSNYWQEFSEVLKERLRKPCKHPTFVMYFLGIIIIMGGFGLLEPVIRFLAGSLKSEDLPRTLLSASYTYFVAIAATAAVDFFLSYQKRRFLLMFFLLCLVVVYLCAWFASAYGAVPQVPMKAIFPAAIGYMLSLFLWWVGNAENANLLEVPVNPTASIGADAQPGGDLTGFNT